MASRLLKDLDPAFYPKACELLARAVELGIHLQIICTRRTQAEHEANVRNGVSWVDHSKHIDGLAIDVVPTAYIALKNWNPYGPYWQALGAIGKSLGLRWGGDWKRRDMGHFELKGD